MIDLPRRLVSKALATALLLTTVVGSGIMAERLSGGNTGLALLANAVATGAMLPVLILIFGPISGAHMNPAVTLILAWRREIAPGVALAYGAAQLLGAVAGVALAHVMFELAVLQTSSTIRSGLGQWMAEAVATAGLILTILGVRGTRPEALPFAIGLYITAAYWFTASTSFANPAVTFARSLTDSFAGIALAGVPGLVAAQCAAALAAAIFWRWISGEGRR